MLVKIPHARTIFIKKNLKKIHSTLASNQGLVKEDSTWTFHDLVIEKGHIVRLADI